MALALVVSALCVAAGAWQWSRHEHRAAAIALVQANYDAPVVPLDRVVSAPGGRVSDGDVWRPVNVVGTYLPVDLLLRNRPVDGVPGLHVLTPFRVEAGAAAGSVLVVDRGWVPAGAFADRSDGAGPVVPAPPEGPVEIVVRLRSDEPPASRTAPPGQVQAISSAGIRAAAAELGTDWDPAVTVRGHGALVTEDGSRPTGLGALPTPTTDPGSHLSYAFQWWVFAVGALVACVVVIVRERRSEADGRQPGGPATVDRPRTTGVSPVGDGPSGAARGQEGPARRRRRTAEEEEDALLDAQEHRSHR